MKKNKKDVSITLKMSKIESDILDKMIEEESKKSYFTVNKSMLIRELIFKKFVNTYKNTLEELGIDTTNKGAIISTIEEVGIDILN